MLIFMDTEFTQLGPHADLISIGLVAEDGRQFYGERRDFDGASVSPFVRAVVLPLLGKQPECIYVGNSLRDAVTRWLYGFEEAEGGAEVRVDFNGDWELLAQLLAHDVPGFITWSNVWYQVDQTVRHHFFELTGLPAHHSLYDALAFRAAYRAPHGR